MTTAQRWIDRLDEVNSERDQQNLVKAIQADARKQPLRKYRVEKYAHRQTEAARNKLAKKYNLLIETLEQIKTLPRGGRAKMLASSTMAFVESL